MLPKALKIQAINHDWQQLVVESLGKEHCQSTQAHSFNPKHRFLQSKAE
jgi:hypothetical protein